MKIHLKIFTLVNVIILLLIGIFYDNVVFLSSTNVKSPTFVEDVQKLESKIAGFKKGKIESQSFQMVFNYTGELQSLQFRLIIDAGATRPQVYWIRYKPKYGCYWITEADNRSLGRYGDNITADILFSYLGRLDYSNIVQQGSPTFTLLLAPEYKKRIVTTNPEKENFLMVNNKLIKAVRGKTYNQSFQFSLWGHNGILRTYLFGFGK